MKRRSRLPLLLVLLFTYILAQLGWWAYLITKLTKTVYAENPKLDTRVWMIWGEGFVFAIILFIGFIFTYRAYLKEIRLAKQQKNFLLSVTHELKTPVASLKLLVETLQSRELNEEQKKIFLSNALYDTDRLTGLIENILQSAKMDSDDYPVYKKNISVTSVVKNTLDKLTPTFGRNHTLKSNLDDVSAIADEQAIQSILINLVDNAVKYSEKNTEITVSLRTDNSDFILSVADQGKGIKKEDRKKIFQKFVRIQNEETRSAKGTGLGLYIVHHLVLKHGGTIDADDNQPCGTVFTVRIPLS
jgi:two-component system phosphate regulon sensor histidine kinase PhoR